jgi:5-methyltetrahydrofolate--homocysteine methyltransferase
VAVFIDEAEALRYMGYRAAPGARALAVLRAQIDEISPRLRSRAIYRVFETERTEGGIALKGGGVLLKGQDIAALLEGCGRAALLAVTLGPEADAILRRAQLEDLFTALAADACLSAAVEWAADELEGEIRRELAPCPLTMRYSPGYGDLPLETQRELLDALDAYRRIGLSLNGGLLMTPQKSVSAVIGIGGGAKRDEPSGKCAGCAARDCAFRAMSKGGDGA